MVYVYARQSELCKYVGKKLKTEEIENVLKDLGMDVKGVSEENDPELKIEITAEKADMISAIGIGRAIRYYLKLESDIPRFQIAKAREKVIVSNSLQNIRPRTVCAILRDVNMSPEILDKMIDIQEKIHDSFGRGRRKASIGIYPLDEIKFPVYFKAEKPEEIIFQALEMDTEMNALQILKEHETGKKFGKLLDGLDRYPVFRDSNKNVLSMPPIINSNKTGRVEVSHKDLFIEISGFNESFLDSMLKVLITTFMEFGARAEAVRVEYENLEFYELSLEGFTEKIELSYINSLIGREILEDEVSDLFLKMGYKVLSLKNGLIEFEIPCYRSDVWNVVDVADDIARGLGYNNITPRFPNISGIGFELEFSRFRNGVSEMLARAGFLEVYTYMLSSSERQFRKMNLNESDFSFFRLIDSEDQGINMLRVLNLPESLEALHVNRKNSYPQKIFENGFTIQIDESSDTGSRDEAHLSVSIADPKSNYTQIKGILDMIMSLENFSFELVESFHPFMIDGRQADILIDGESVGFIGELHPLVLENFGLLVPVASLELNLQKIFDMSSLKK